MTMIVMMKMQVNQGNFQIVQGNILFERATLCYLLFWGWSTITDYINFYSSEDERPSNKNQRPSFSLNTDGDIAGLRKKKQKVNPLLMQTGMGSWEVHTKGIGAKLLLQVYIEY